MSDKTILDDVIRRIVKDMIEKDLEERNTQNLPFTHDEWIYWQNMEHKKETANNFDEF